MKVLTSKDVLIFEKHGNTLSEIAEKFSMSELQVEESIRKLFPQRRASNLISAFRKSEKRMDADMKRNSKIKQQPKVPNVIPEAVIVVDKVTDDNVGKIVEAVEQAFSKKTHLEVLQEKESFLLESLAKAEQELHRLHGIQAEVFQKVQSLTDEVQELKATIDHKIAEVGELRDYSAEVRNQIATSELDVEAIQMELQETQEAIKIEQLVTITVLADGWFKFEPETIKIPNVEVSSDELSEIFSTFILDPQFETISRKDIRQLIMLDKMIKALENEHYDINVKFENYVLENAWMSWKAE